MRRRSRSRDSADSDERKKRGVADWKIQEDKRWKVCREHRERIAEEGCASVWGHSPTHTEIQQVYLLNDEVEREAEEERKKAEKLRKIRVKERRQQERENGVDVSESEESESESSSSEEEKKKKKRKKNKKEKKAKREKKAKKDKKKKAKKRKAAKSSDDESEEDRKKKKKKDKKNKKKKAADSDVEMKSASEAEDASVKAAEVEEEEEFAGPAVPPELLHQDRAYNLEKINYGKDMLRGEAEGMAAYIARGERIPRRGEIGLSSNEISEYEKVGYVMSGTRHKAMEATRLRKENQILTAEEKRLLSGFSNEERKKKDDAIMSQFRQLVDANKK